MKKLIKTFGICALFASSSYACPNLNGEYKFENEWNGSLVITQTGCDTIQVDFVEPNGTVRYQAILLTNSNLYEKKWDKDMNSISNIPATLNSSSFDQASYSGDRFVWREFSGERSKCEGKYSFTDFDCKMFEHSLGYDKILNTYTWTQVGHWRGADGRYENTIFELQKIR